MAGIAWTHALPQNSYRERVFLQTKADGCNRDVVGRQLDQSLRRLRTNHIDLRVFHEVLC